MSKADAKKFIEDLASDEKLRAEVRRTALVDALVQVGKAHGKDFTPEDLRGAYADWYKAQVGKGGSVSAEDMKDLSAYGPGQIHTYYGSDYKKGDYAAAEYASADYAKADYRSKGAKAPAAKAPAAKAPAAKAPAAKAPAAKVPAAKAPAAKAPAAKAPAAKAPAAKKGMMAAAKKGAKPY